MTRWSGKGPTTPGRVGLIVLALATLAPASPDDATLKAALTLKLVQFVTWPEGALEEEQTLAVGLFGEADMLDGLAGRASKVHVRGHRVTTRRVSDTPDLEGIHVLVASRDATRDAIATLQKLGPTPMLSIGEERRFAEKAGMVALHMNDRRLRFDVNLAVVEASGLRISSQALELAQVVHR